jgi:DNA-binding transcriptional MerR regulator
MLTIGKLAALADVRTDTLRYYEREHLLAPASKSDSGYRLYDSDSVRRVRFIKRAQHCGFLEDRIRTMKTMSKALDRLIADCAVPSHPVGECPILSALDRADGVG